MSLFTYPTAAKEPAKKGRIGMARRIHYVLTFNDDTKDAVGACRKVSGPVEFVSPYTRATCPDCVGLLMNKKINKTVTTNEKVREITL